MEKHLMISITIDSKQNLIAFYQLATVVKAKGKQSRAVTKFGKLLLEKCTELQEDEKELIAQYFEVKEDGNANKDDIGQPILLGGASESEYNSEWVSLHDEPTVIDITEYQPYLESLIKGLEEWDQELSGTDAIIYDELLDLLESIENKDAE